MQMERLKERDSYEMDNLGGYRRIYPPVKDRES